MVNLAGSEERRGNGILHEAAKSGRCTDLENFLSETNIDAPNNIGETALHLAAEFEHARDVAILLRAGATIQVSHSCSGYTRWSSHGQLVYERLGQEMLTLSMQLNTYPPAGWLPLLCNRPAVNFPAITVANYTAWRGTWL